MFGKKQKRSLFPAGSLITTALGAGAAYFFDPDRGRYRRNMVGQKIYSVFKTTEKKAERTGRYLGAEAQGFRAKLEHLGSREQIPPNDQTLIDKVRSEMFQGYDEVDPGTINVDAADGTVTLRGQVTRPEQVQELEKRARRITGVVNVVNFLHTPGTEPPNVQEALEASRSGNSLTVTERNEL